jgi:hypothetical protein
LNLFILYIIGLKFSKNVKLSKLTLKKKVFLEHTNVFSTEFFVLKKKNSFISFSENLRLNKFNTLLNSKIELITEKNTNNNLFLLFIQQYLTKTTQSPVLYKNVNLQNVIPLALLNYIMYSVKSVR